MTRTIRTLAAKLLVGGACLAPLALPAAALADQPNAPLTVPQARKLTPKEQHQRLLKSSGWIQQRAGDKILSHGTGWVLDAERKLMVTNDHVVQGQDVVWVVFPKYKDGKLVRERAEYDGEKGVKATVVDRDRGRDLAVIQLESLPDGTAALPLADAEPEEFDPVRTIGGYTNGSEELVFGGVGGEVRTVGVNGGLHGNGKVRVVLSSVGINDGNSGGPLVNEAGELVGVNSYTVLRGWNGSEVKDTSGHISVKELQAYLAVVDPLVAPTAAGLVARGERKLTAGRYDAAVKDFSAALAKDEANAKALYLRGKAFTDKGDARTALEDLNAAVKLDGGNAKYRIARGQAHRALGKTEEAVGDFSAAIRTDPSDWEGYNQRGITHYRANKMADAEADFARAIEKEPGLAVAWANRGEARFSQKKYADAVQDFARAAELEPANAGYVAALGNSLINAGKPQKAVEVFVEAARKYGNPAFLSRAGTARLAAGEYTLARDQFTEALRAFGDKGKPADVALAYQGRGIAQRELKNYKEAIDDCTKAIDLNSGKNGYDYLERGRAYRANGQANAAEDDFKAAERLGLKVERTGGAEPKPGEPPADKLTAESLVGEWKMTHTANGMAITQVIVFSKDGTWEATRTLTTAYGTDTLDDSGTWKLDGDKLTIKGAVTGKVVRTVERDGADLDVHMAELGATVTFRRAK